MPCFSGQVSLLGIFLVFSGITGPNIHFRMSWCFHRESLIAANLEIQQYKRQDLVSAHQILTAGASETPFYRDVLQSEQAENYQGEE